MTRYKVRWSQEAARDLDHVLEWYFQEAGMSVANKVYSRIKEQTESLATFPERARPGREKGTREYVLSRVPYIAVMEVQGEEVWILNLLHMKKKFPQSKK
ncbi:MAG: type II toxin-antitoxin system RelE/ParE family toxin [Azoarcus sp.]|jgi:toxin ParE1/3/4|nr:type II toxin-antitoxin system RelE/ParE family toxin [Azoarcus sp.]